MMMNKSFIPFMIFLLLPLTLSGQGNDFGIWAGITGKHEFSKRIDADLNVSIRTTDNTSILDQYFAEGGINYNISGFLSAGGSVRLINKLEDDLKYHFRQKLYLNIKGEVLVGKLAFSGRVMYQRALRTYAGDGVDPLAENYLRFRIKSGYESKSSPLKPFISFEPFFPVFDEAKSGIEKTRTSAGTVLKITSKSSVEAAFIFENFTKEGKAGKNILSVGFQQIF